MFGNSFAISMEENWLWVVFLIVAVISLMFFFRRNSFIYYSALLFGLVASFLAIYDSLTVSNSEKATSNMADRLNVVAQNNFNIEQKIDYQNTAYRSDHKFELGKTPSGESQLISCDDNEFNYVCFAFRCSQEDKYETVWKGVFEDSEIEYVVYIASNNFNNLYPYVEMYRRGDLEFGGGFYARTNEWGSPELVLPELVFDDLGLGRRLERIFKNESGMRLYFVDHQQNSRSGPFDFDFSGVFEGVGHLREVCN